MVHIFYIIFNTSSGGETTLKKLFKIIDLTAVNVSYLGGKNDKQNCETKKILDFGGNLGLKLEILIFL